MGVKGLFQFLKRYEQESSIRQAVEYRTVGVDLFWFIHHSKGDFFVFQDYLTPLIRYATKVHCVVDGAPPKDTKEERKEKRKKREEAKKAIHEIEKTENVAEKDQEVDKQLKRQKEKLTHQAWYPTREYVEYVKQWLVGEGCVIHQAAVDADSELIRLEQTQWIDVIVSNDSDLLTLGANYVVRIYSPEDAGVYDRSKLCQVLELTPTQWIDFMNLCRTMERKDVMMAYSFIRVYKEFDYALERYDALHLIAEKQQACGA